MSLERKECKEIIDKYLNDHDMESFNIFHDQFYRIVHEHARKWNYSIQKASMGLYEYDDVYQELWLGVIKKMPTYDPTRSNPVTWMYMILGSICGMLYRSYNNTSRGLSEDQKFVYVNDNIYDGDGGETQILDLIIDPSGSFENQYIDENQVFIYVYLLSKLIPKLNTTQKICYLHSVKGVKQHESANILGLSQSYISRILKSTIEKARRTWDKIDRQNVDIDELHSLTFALLSKKPDDELHEELKLDLGVIKICREILSLANLYGR